MSTLSAQRNPAMYDRPRPPATTLLVRGGPGCGKSHAVRGLLENSADHVVGKIYNQIFSKRPKLVGYSLRDGLVVLGNYEQKRRKMGGLDGFRPAATLWEYIHEVAHKATHVVFESLFISNNFGRSLNLARAVGPNRYIDVLVDTPWEVAEARIFERNGGREWKRHYSQKDWAAARRNHENLRKEGVRCLEIDGLGDTGGQLEAILRSEDWRPGGMV